MSDSFVRPDPDALLESLKLEEERETKKRGRLKVFFGMAAGVGKTFAMLESSHRLVREGNDCVIGYVETHGRFETNELVEGLELLPRKKIDYKGIVIEEFDIDGALARNPAFVLVDELAHTNAEGSRHRKRYQDVRELLDHGINVFTTVNVQHLESQADIVEKITGVKIRETLPDSMLDEADEIELVDIPPEELIKRLSEGKVYLPERAGTAKDNFFKQSNIAALRELALHYVARLVDYDLRDYTHKKNIKGPWKAGEVLLVAVSPSPYSEYLIRWTRRVAFNYKAPWIALYIEKQKELSESARELLRKNLNLARDLGAEVISTADEDIVSGLLRVASRKNVTQIIMGKPLKRYFTDFFRGGNLVERMIRKCGDIEIHVVTQPSVTDHSFSLFGGMRRFSPTREYLVALAGVALVTVCNLLLVPFTGYWTIALVYLFSTALLALLVGRGPVLLAAAVSALSWNYLFIPPLYTLRIGRLEDALMFSMYFIIAIILGGLTSRLRLKEKALRSREKRISDMYELSNVLGNARTMDEIIETAGSYIERYLDARVALFVAKQYGSNLSPPPKGSLLELSEKDRGVVEWVYKNRKPAGLYTTTLPQTGAHFTPLLSPGGIVGVIGIRPSSRHSFTPEAEGFLQSVVSQIALRIEHEILSEANRNALLVAESERLHKVLLNSISHELRTPLTMITGASSGLLDETISANPAARKELAEGIKKGSERLNRLVDNLLDMSRLESGLLKIKPAMYDVSDLLSVTLRRLSDELTAHRVTVSVADGMPMVNIDFALMEQALINLVYNAVSYTPEGSEIAVIALAQNGYLNIAVKDNGPGIIEKDIPYLFDKFRRGSNVGTGGTGLGLSICRGIIEAHGGTIRAANRPEGGAVFVIEIPIHSTGD
jgi:two-component system sensor histidine kinase KdpD